MEIPGRGVLVRCYNTPTECTKITKLDPVTWDDPAKTLEVIGSPPLVSLIHIHAQLRGFDAVGNEVYYPGTTPIVTWKLV